MDCTLHSHLLEAYLDGELGFERALEVEAHLASCGPCFAEVEGWKDLRMAMRGTELYHRAPAQLEDKLRQLLPQSRTERTPWFRQVFWATGGAAFSAAVMLFTFVLVRPPGPSPTQDLVTSHVRSLTADHLMDVVSTDQHTVKPWFDGKLDYAPPVQDFAADGYPLAGGRIDYLEDRKVAVLIYHRALHIINVYVWPAEDNGSSAIRSETTHGYDIVSWRKNGFEFRAVSDLNVPELRDLARLFMP